MFNFKKKKTEDHGIIILNYRCRYNIISVYICLFDKYWLFGTPPIIHYDFNAIGFWVLQFLTSSRSGGAGEDPRPFCWYYVFLQDLLCSIDLSWNACEHVIFIITYAYTKRMIDIWLSSKSPDGRVFDSIQTEIKKRSVCVWWIVKMLPKKRISINSTTIMVPI